MNKSQALAVIISLVTHSVWAHDPIFGLGPHVLFKDGIEISIETNTEKSSDNRSTEPAIELAYGITGDWAAGIEMPYVFNRSNDLNSQGMSDLSVFTKYRFWRKDTLGQQQSAAVLLKIKANNGDENATPSIGTGTIDSIVGLTYGFEGRTWYRWASIRYRKNGTNNAGFHRGNKLLVDFVGGLRPNLTGYTEPDTVWLLELNGEFSDPADLRGVDIENTGGSQWFLSPGIFWTKHNFAIKAAIQIPILNHLDGNREQDDYRAKLVFEWHL